jgi:hypothetical protein
MVSPDSFEDSEVTLECEGSWLWVEWNEEVEVVEAADDAHSNVE